ncbi:two-component system regulatory protein YycI, partial [Staphylococcus saprophyticus]|uniref:two-component system regulatory protein YycI n=1 Tax=Staphylococcus saprophyticus TaxID=29385 RepID=UPI001642B9A5
HTEQRNPLNFKQQQITIPHNLPTLKPFKIQLFTPPSFHFSSYPKSPSHISTQHSPPTPKPQINNPLHLPNHQYTPLKSYLKHNLYKPNHYQMTNIHNDKLTFQQTYHHYPIIDNNKPTLHFNLNNHR